MIIKGIFFSFNSFSAINELSIIGVFKEINGLAPLLSCVTLRPIILAFSYCNAESAKVWIVYLMMILYERQVWLLVIDCDAAKFSFIF